MSNLLKMAISETIRTLHRRGWSQRRIADERGINRETVARHLRQAEPLSKPANAPPGSTTPDATPKPASAPSGSERDEGAPGLIVAPPGSAPDPRSRGSGRASDEQSEGSDRDGDRQESMSHASTSHLPAKSRPLPGRTS